jgi:hypothetical protein
MHSHGERERELHGFPPFRGQQKGTNNSDSDGHLGIKLPHNTTRLVGETLNKQLNEHHVGKKGIMYLHFYPFRAFTDR